jgi:hypothetical protein
MERIVDPLTGRKMQRQSLGRCLYGKLKLVPPARSQGIDLYWVGSVVQSALSDELKALMEMCWRNLSLSATGNASGPKSWPIQVNPGRYWLCRLANGCYAVEEGEQGSELFELFGHPKMKIRRPT